jgi:histidinol-phosphate aminotransferase
MYINKNLHLTKINRLRVSEGRDLKYGLRLDRNEKVDNWESGLIDKALKSKPECFNSTYPEITTLYKKLSDHLSVDESQILITSGIDGSIKNLLEVACNAGDNIAVFSPTYAMYQVYSDIYQLNLLPINYTKDYKINESDLNSFLENNPRILFIPNPNQPIESCLSSDEVAILAKKCKEKKCIIVLDEAYHLFGSQSSIPLLKKFDNIIVMRTFSKGFGVPSIRVGLTIANKNIMEIISKPRLAHELSSISIAIAEYLIDNFEIVQKNCTEVVDSRNFISNELKKLGLEVHGSNGNYLLITFHSNSQASKIVEYLRENKIYVKGPWKDPWSKSITISIGPKKIMQKFLDHIQIFLDN